MNRDTFHITHPLEPKFIGPNYRDGINKILKVYEIKPMYIPQKDKLLKLSNIELHSVKLGVVNLEGKAITNIEFSADYIDPADHPEIIVSVNLKGRTKVGLFAENESFKVFLSPKLTENENIFELKPGEKIRVRVVDYKKQVSVNNFYAKEYKIVCVGAFISKVSEEVQETWVPDF